LKNESAQVTLYKLAKENVLFIERKMLTAKLIDFDFKDAHSRSASSSDEKA